MTLLDRFEKFLSLEKRYSPHTVKAYLTDLRAFQDYCELQYEFSEWEKVQTIHIRSWIVQLMKQDVSPRSVGRKLSSLRSYYKYLQRRSLVEQNPARGIKAPRIAKRHPVSLRKDHVSAMFESFEDLTDWTKRRDAVIISLLYHTGMRRAELLGLKRSDVDLGQRKIRVMGKGGKERILPISDGLASMIDAYLAACEAEFGELQLALILNNNGQIASPRFVYTRVRKVLEQYCAAEKLSPHVLRHSFATHLSETGAELHAIKELLGHANLSATQIYTHNSLDKLRSAYEQAHPHAD